MNGQWHSLFAVIAAIGSVSLGSFCVADDGVELQPLELDFLGDASARSADAAWFSGPIDEDIQAAHGPVMYGAYSGVSLAAAQETAASDAQMKHPDSDLHFGVAFTLWLPGIDGTLGVGAVTQDVSATFIDILDNSNTVFGFGGGAEYRGEKFGAYLTGYWSTVEVDLAGPGGTITNTSDIGLVGFGVLYEVGRWSVEHTATDDLPARDMTLTLYGGARFTSIFIEFDFPILPTVSDSRTWVDPMIGAKFTYPFSQNWSVVLGGDIGGFGAASDFAWAAAAAISWDFHIKSMPSSLQLGYLAIGDDYTTGSGTDRFEWDAVLHGVMMNFVMRF
jgi:hypothetical protein